MCPVCLATVALIAGSVTSSGGLAAVAIRKLGGKVSREENGAGEMASNSDRST